MHTYSVSEWNRKIKVSHIQQGRTELNQSSSEEKRLNKLSQQEPESAGVSYSKQE